MKQTLIDFHPDTVRFFKGKNIYITGGTGFIGWPLVQMIAKMGANVIVLSRKPLNEIDQLADGSQRITYCNADLNDFAAVRESMKDIDVVIHLAALVAGIKYNKNHPASIFRTNLQMFLNTIQAAVENNVDVFSCCSSACVYPRHCSIPTVEEEGMLNEPEPTNSGYGWAKRMMEYTTQKYHEEFGLKVSIPRPYNAYGPRDNFDTKSSHVIPALIDKALTTNSNTFEVWGDGSHSRSFVYVDDFARGVIECTARHQYPEPINIGVDEEITIRELASQIGQIVSEYRGVEIVPTFNDQGITGQPRRKCCTRRLQERLGYQPRFSLSEGLKQTIKWRYLTTKQNQQNTEVV